jgi:hypothetical protein
MGGAKYIREQLDRFDGDVSLALAAYNAGWPAVKKHGGIPPFSQTQAYVPKVLEIFGGGDITAGASQFDALSALSENFNSAFMPDNIGQNGGTSTSSANLNDLLTQMMMMFMMNMQMGMGSNSTSFGGR